MNEQKIEGLPLGTKLVRIGKAKAGEWGIDSFGCPWRINHEGDTLAGVTAIIEPDNVYGKIDLSLVPIPEGWERLPEDWYREPLVGDSYISAYGNGAVSLTASGGTGLRIIIRKKAPSNAYGKAIDSIAIPEGWEKVGFREPTGGDYYLGWSPDPDTNKYYIFNCRNVNPMATQDGRRIIVKRKKKRYIVAKQEVPDNWMSSFFSVNVRGVNGESGKYVDDVRVELSIIEE